MRTELPRRRVWTLLAFVVALSVPGALIASDFPPFPTVLPVQHPAPIVSPPARVVARTPFKAPTTKADLDSIGLSPTIYLYALTHLTGAAPTVSSFSTSLATAAQAPKRTSRRGLTPITLSSVSGPTIINNPPDPNEDREPSFTTVRNSQTHTETQYAAWMQFDGNPNNTNFHIRASSNAGGGWTAAPTLQGTRANLGDPMLSPNNYVGGFNPQTVYCGAVNFNPGSGTPFGDSAILVWKKTAGSGWTSQEAESHTGQLLFQNGQWIEDRWFLDKPGIAVSQHAGTAGTVYATYIRQPVNGNPGAQTIGFAMLDDVTAPVGQWKIRTDVPIPFSGGQVQSPIVVNQTSSELLGTVYVIYFDRVRSVIYVYRSSDKGASWSADGTFSYDLKAYGIYLGGYDEPRICVDAPSGNCVNATSTITARFNWHSGVDAPDGSIGIVFNAWDGNPNVTPMPKMRSYFMRWNPFPGSCGIPCRGFDRGPTALTDNTLDSWNPAIDFDASGNYAVSWYRRIDNSSLQYKTVFSYVGNDGTYNFDITCASCRTSDAAHYTKVANYAYHLGEYQDIWYTSYLGFACAATVDVSANYGGVWYGDIASYNVVP